MLKIRILVLLIGLLVISVAAIPGTPATGGERSFVIIVHPDNPAESLTRDTASRLFLKKLSGWKEGDFTEKAKPVDQSANSPVREEFSNVVFKKSVSAIKSYWQRMIFSGRDVPPDELPSDKAVVDFVKANRGAIGYVSVKADLEGVKELPLLQENED